MIKKLATTVAAVAALGTIASPALAVPTNGDTVGFSGAVTDSCTVETTANGTMTQAANGQSMGSEESGGSAATVAVNAVGTPPLVDFAVPNLVGAPAGYSGTPTNEIAYTSTDGASQAYTSSASTSSLNSGSTVYTVHGRVSDSSGLVGGSYSMTTVATCYVD